MLAVKRAIFFYFELLLQVSAIFHRSVISPFTLAALQGNKFNRPFLF
jgi:hypothetical protein